MKQAVQWIGGFKAYVGLIFGGEVLVYTAISGLFGNTTLSFSMVWQFLAIAVCAALLQQLCFGTLILKHTRFWVRILLFTVKLFAVLALFAWWFRWFPLEQLTAWLIFGGVFLAAEAAIAAGFAAYHRITGEHYTAKLELYQQAMEPPSKS